MSCTCAFHKLKESSTCSLKIVYSHGDSSLSDKLIKVIQVDTNNVIILSTNCMTVKLTPISQLILCFVLEAYGTSCFLTRPFLYLPLFWLVFFTSFIMVLWYTIGNVLINWIMYTFWIVLTYDLLEDRSINNITINKSFLVYLIN